MTSHHTAESRRLIPHKADDFCLPCLQTTHGSSERLTSWRSRNSFVGAERMSQLRASIAHVESASSRKPTDGAAGEAQSLVAAVRSVQTTLGGLLAHESLLAPSALNAVRLTLEEVEERLGRQELQVVVVGERNSGKSTLLDAIVGDRLLSGARGQSKTVTFLR